MCIYTNISTNINSNVKADIKIIIKKERTDAKNNIIEKKEVKKNKAKINQTTLEIHTFDSMYI